MKENTKNLIPTNIEEIRNIKDLYLKQKALNYYWDWRKRAKKQDKSNIISVYNKKYNNRPEVKERLKEYKNRPEVKKRLKEYYKEYNNRPEVKERLKAYKNRPEVKERLKEYYKEYYKKRHLSNS